MEMGTEVIPSEFAAQVSTTCETPSHDYVVLAVEARRREILIELGDVESVERTEVVLAPAVKTAGSVENQRGSA